MVLICFIATGGTMGHPSSGRSAVDEANGVIEADIIVDRLRQKQQLRAVESCDVCHAGF
jgi:hypothetical protein